MPTVFRGGLDCLDITDYIFLDDDGEDDNEEAVQDSSALGKLPEGLGPDCTGIVLHSSSPSLQGSASAQACASIRPQCPASLADPAVMLRALSLGRASSCRLLHPLSHVAVAWHATPLAQLAFSRACCLTISC